MRWHDSLFHISLLAELGQQALLWKSISSKKAPLEPHQWSLMHIRPHPYHLCSLLSFSSLFSFPKATKQGRKVVYVCVCDLVRNRERGTGPTVQFTPLSSHKCCRCSVLCIQVCFVFVCVCVCGVQQHSEMDEQGEIEKGGSWPFSLTFDVIWHLHLTLPVHLLEGLLLLLHLLLQLLLVVGRWRVIN